MAATRCCRLAWCLSNDPCGLVCAFMTHGLIVYANFAILYGVLLPWYSWTAPAVLHYTIFAIISALAMLSHLRAMTTNPGAVPLQCPLPPHVDESRSHVPMCHRCDGYKPPRAHHCSQCNRCIFKMDHHCPWVNNCVGHNNQKHFILFLCYTLTLSAYALTLLAMRAASSMSQLESATRTRNRPAALLRPAHGSGGGSRAAGDDAAAVFMNCMLFFEAILFGLFTAAMLTDQLTSILNDTTAIERLKKEDRDRVPHASCLYALSETFGRPCSLLWLVPTSVKFNGLTYEQLSAPEMGAGYYEFLSDAGHVAPMGHDSDGGRSDDYSCADERDAELLHVTDALSPRHAAQFAANDVMS